MEAIGDKLRHDPGILVGVILGSVLVLSILIVILYRLCTRRNNGDEERFKQESAAYKGRGSSEQVLTNTLDNPKRQKESMSKRISLIINKTGTIKSMQNPEPTNARVESLDHVSTTKFLGKFGHVIQADFSHKPSADDEIGVRVGDPLAIYKTFADGWAMGMNWRVQLSGFFPLNVFKREHHNRIREAS